VPNIEVDGRTLELNDEGFLADPEAWDEQVARRLAQTQEGIDEMSDEHWAVVRFIRGYYVEHRLAPTVRALCKASGVPLRQVYVLFPSGPAKGACKLAGLPKPDGCV
jgi:tRNA 2-thiouridine synthesizing protein E